MVAAEFFSDLDALNRIDWAILRNRDFKRDVNDLGKIERYQAEALIHRTLPAVALLGIACADNDAAAKLQRASAEAGVALKVVVRPEWYFQ